MTKRGNVTLHSSYITCGCVKDGKSVSQGAAAFIADNGRVNIFDTVFKNNTSFDMGGAIALISKK